MSPRTFHTLDEIASIDRIALGTREYMLAFERAGFTRDEAFKFALLWLSEVRAKSTNTPLHVGLYL